LEESVYGTGGGKQPIMPGEILERMIAIGSPECISTYIINKIGLYDPKLAPHAYHTHDYCLRTLKKGYHNYLFSLAFQSEINWGGTRENPHPHKLATFSKNRRYVYQQHHRYLDQLQQQMPYFKNQKPYLLIDPKLNQSELTRLQKNYYRLRKYVLNEDLRGRILVFLVALIGRDNIIKIKQRLGLKI
jgi:hypothetical protein